MGQIRAVEKGNCNARQGDCASKVAEREQDSLYQWRNDLLYALQEFQTASGVY